MAIFASKSVFFGFILLLLLLAIGILNYERQRRHIGFSWNASSLSSAFRRAGTSSTATTIVIAGFLGCGDHEKALRIGREKLLKTMPHKYMLEIHELANKANFTSWLYDDRWLSTRPKGERAIQHESSPYIFEKETLFFIGNENDFEAYVSKAISGIP